MAVPRIAGAAVAALVLLGCGSAPANQATPPAATQAAPTPTEGPTVAPDVSAPFKTAYAAMKTGIMTLSGQITVGQVQVSVAGTTTVNGPDAADTTTTTVGGVATSAQHVRVAGVRYVKNGTGPWLTDSSPAPSSELDKELARLAGLVTDAGTEVRGSATVHRLTTPAGSAFDPAAFGIAGATNVKATVVFFALEDGTPSAVTIDLTWTQPAGTSTVDGSLSIDVEFSQLGVPQIVKAPDHVWPFFTSKANAFSIAYPDDFDTTSYNGVDYFSGPNTQFVGVGRSALQAGVVLNGLTAGEVAAIKKTYKTTTVQNDAFTLAGQRARFLTASGTDPNSKTKVILYEVLVIKGKYAYYVFWQGPVGSRAADLVTFKEMLQTFSFK